mmetsp:Transcript_6915/g.11528  ORF Transcript_6915/g.11528 Transcript_6915/m.11528 type:complete len:411 (+) Transcript_6915:97-1329(+)
MIPVFALPTLAALLILNLAFADTTAKDVSEEHRIIGLLPKIELHAHLHGSIRISTLRELAAAQGIDANIGEQLNLEECFKLFAIVHKIVSSIDVVKRVLQEVIYDYMDENTLYLELRTTPRALPDGTTQEKYVETLVDLVQNHNNNAGHKMMVKLILSIDRGQRFRDAVTISQLAGDFRFWSNSVDDPIKTIVGLDFSGNPLGGSFENFSPLFDNARDAGLGITIHTGELSELSDSIDPLTAEDETTSILNFRPERIGHALYLEQHHFDTMLELMRKGEAPAIEVCPTSNQITLGHDTHSDHPYIRNWRKHKYPMSINTDDRGIFNTTLTLELLHTKTVLNLDMAEMVDLIGSMITQSFASEKEKIFLKDRYWKQINDLIEETKKENQAMFTPTKNSVKQMADMSYLITV